MTDEAGRTVSYTYTKAGQVATTTVPGLGTATLAYDSVGNLSKVTDGAGLTTGFTYNARSLIASRLPDRHRGCRLRLRHQGTRTPMTDAAGTVAYTFDYLTGSRPSPAGARPSPTATTQPDHQHRRPAGSATPTPTTTTALSTCQGRHRGGAGRLRLQPGRPTHPGRDGRRVSLASGYHRSARSPHPRRRRGRHRAGRPDDHPRPSATQPDRGGWADQHIYLRCL